MNDVAPTEFLEAPRAREWGWFKRFCFQAALIYSLLFTVPMMLGYFPSLTVLPHQQKAFEERQQARTAAARAAESRPSAASQPAASQPAASQSAASRPTAAAASDDAPNAIVGAAGVALGKWSGWRRAAVDWTAEHGAQALIRCGLVRENFKIAIVVQPTGSGDTMINYVACLIEAVIALVVSLVWTVLGVAVGASSRLHGALAGFLEWLLAGSSSW